MEMLNKKLSSIYVIILNLHMHTYMYLQFHVHVYVYLIIMLFVTFVEIAHVIMCDISYYTISQSKFVTLVV